ncbi:glycoside hydrolase [Chenggangzhangella methanolivorans]|uniref:Glycoside hydrolase n=1 Tax=Chenggangzhangella methanolivorans TaxID=1437009 RepID=A0A9E6REU3_9HYPH|nr:glycoside hydrolase [Chenggangzhangella methanolivorans]
MVAGGLVALAAFDVAPPATSASNDWVPVRETNLEVAAGSPLDFSRILKSPPVEASNRILVNAQGRFARADAPEAPARMMCASLAWSPASGGFPDKPTADRYALQLKRHGYDLARFHFVDAALMFGRKRDFDFDPDTLDRVNYLMAALKKNGISWILDGLTSWRGGYGGFDDRWDPSSDLKLRVLVDDDAFEHWRRLVTMTLGSLNPYTGKRPIDDPALTLVVPVNEGGVEFDSILREKAGVPHYSPLLEPKWNGWLRARYRTTDALSTAWGGLGAGQKLETGAIDLPTSRYEKSARMRDFQAFLVDVETKAAARMTRVIRDLGYSGPIAPYNNWPSLQTALSRRNQDAVALNAYQDWVGGYQPGSKIGQVSSIGDGAFYVRAMAGGRWLDRPFVITEYDHLFWSRSRYEAGLVFPAYAALQGWDAICRHAHGPIILAYGEPYLHKRQMLPYAIALDPVARAGETLAALLFRRGDVAEAKTVVPFAARGEQDLTDSMQSREADPLTRLALVAKIGLKDADRIAPGELAVRQPRDPRQALEIFGELKAKGLLPKDAGDPAAGRTVSQTGEIVLNEGRGRITLDAPNTKAIAFGTLDEPVSIGPLTVARADVGALFSVSSLDGEPVAKSRKLLVIFATDARNSGMRFRDAAEKTIEDFGRLPVLIRRGEIDVRLAGKGAWLLSPVGLDGAVGAPVAAGDGELSTRLSNVTQDGPTTYFLIERPEGA